MQEEGKKRVLKMQGRARKTFRVRRREKSFTEVQDEPVYSQTHWYVTNNNRVGNSMNVQQRGGSLLHMD